MSIDVSLNKIYALEMAHLRVGHWPTLPLARVCNSCLPLVKSTVISTCSNFIIQLPLLLKKTLLSLCFIFTHYKYILYNEKNYSHPINRALRFVRLRR